MTPPARRADTPSTAGVDIPAATPPALRQVALLAPAPAESAEVLRLLQTARKARGKRQSLSGLFAPAPEGKREDARQALQGALLRDLEEALFCDALARQLRERLDIRVTPESQTQAALAALRLTPAQAAQPEGARALCARLGCDAVLAPQVIRVSVREEKTRDLAFWVAVQMVGPRLSEDLAVRRAGTRSRRRSRREEPGLAAPSEIIAAGAASSGRALFRMGYARTRLNLADQAARQAAARAAHTLETGEAGPLMQPQDRIALAPVPAPPQADQLLFTPQGRRVLPGVVRGLPPDVSSRFTPDLLPLFGKAVIALEETRRAMTRLGLAPAALWAQEEQPEKARAQALGRQLGVDYLLLAHVTDIEMEAGTADPQAGHPAGPGGGRLAGSALESARPMARERVARAEAAGALVRVADGAVLWSDRAAESMTVRPEDSLTAGLSDRQVAEDAVHFALLELQRRFRRYRARFER
ncbi:MAG TPA: hypothetical protein VKT32_06225 [Chthonomonadaceae bacterium]|nr:hypothetical protein [Chthonomonadaceae bacterium]